MPNNTFYSRQYREFGHSVKALGWGSTQSQEKRFKALCEVGIADGDSLLDVGCGFGDLYIYLYNKEIKVGYTGLDNNETFIELNKKNNPNLDFECGDITTMKGTYDWVVASGIFCFKKENWVRDTLHTIRSMFHLSRKGTAFNCLFLQTRHNIPPWTEKPPMKFDKTNSQMHYLTHEEAGKLLGYLLHFSGLITVKNNYLNNDITFFMHK